MHSVRQMLWTWIELLTYFSIKIQTIVQNSAAVILILKNRATYLLEILSSCVCKYNSSSNDTLKLFYTFIPILLALTIYAAHLQMHYIILWLGICAELGLVPPLVIGNSSPCISNMLLLGYT